MCGNLKKGNLKIEYGLLGKAIGPKGVQRVGRTRKGSRKGI
jgi:hypothetical protein